MGAIQQAYTHTNTSAAKIWGLGTIAIALLLLPQWGVASATVLIFAGALPYHYAHIGPRQLIRWVALHVTYWTLIVLGAGLGVT